MPRFRAAALVIVTAPVELVMVEAALPVNENAPPLCVRAAVLVIPAAESVDVVETAPAEVIWNCDVDPTLNREACDDVPIPTSPVAVITMRVRESLPVSRLVNSTVSVTNRITPVLAPAVPVPSPDRILSPPVDDPDSIVAPGNHPG